MHAQQIGQNNLKKMEDVAMKAKIIFISLLIFGAVSFLFGQVLPDSSQLSAYRNLETKFQKIYVH